MAENLPNELVGTYYERPLDRVVVEIVDPRRDPATCPLRDAGDNAVIGRLSFYYSAELQGDIVRPSVAGRPISVTMTWGDGVTASHLQRFSWKRWLAVADATRRSELGGGEEASVAGMRALMAWPDAPRKRGPKGHGSEFYEEIAKEYLAIRKKGIESPDKAIARDRGVNRNTVAGWIRKCRQLGLLPPGRPGRAG